MENKSQNQNNYNWKIIPDPIKCMIMEICEDHRIRLTPKEYEELVRDYKSKFITKVDVSSLMQLAENVIRRNK